MKKTHLIIILAAMALLAGCKEDNSTEGKITKAMKEYARKNFDDPKSLVEIPLVEANEVFDAKAYAMEVLSTSAKTDSLCEKRYDSVMSQFGELTEIISEYNKHKHNVDDSYRERALGVSISFYAWVDNLLAFSTNKKMFDFYYNEVDSLVANKDIYPITTYNINARVKEKDELKIRHFYTWSCDTTTVFEIYNEPIPKDRFKEEIMLYEECGKLIEYGTKRMDYVKEGEELIQKMRLLFI